MSQITMIFGMTNACLSKDHAYLCPRSQGYSLISMSLFSDARENYSFTSTLLCGHDGCRGLDAWGWQCAVPAGCSSCLS